MSADGQDKFISVVQEVIELWAVIQGGRRLQPIKVSSCGQDKLLASIICTVGHLLAGATVQTLRKLKYTQKRIL